MSGEWKGAFTDRAAALAAFDHFVRQSDAKVFVLWGVAGTGKSRLLDELRSRIPGDQRSALVNLSELISSDHNGTQGEQAPTGALLSRIARALGSWDPPLRNQVVKYERKAAKAVLLMRPADVRVDIIAENGGVVAGNTIHIDSGPSAETYAQYRRQLLEALTGLVRHVSRPGVLLLDTAELLALLDDVAVEQPARGRPPLSH